MNHRDDREESYAVLMSLAAYHASTQATSLQLLALTWNAAVAVPRIPVSALPGSGSWVLTEPDFAFFLTAFPPLYAVLAASATTSDVGIWMGNPDRGHRTCPLVFRWAVSSARAHAALFGRTRRGRLVTAGAGLVRWSRHEMLI